MILSTLKNIQDFWLHIKEMFVVIFASKKDFSEFYSNRIDCLGNQLPKSYIDDETEELMDKETVINEAENKRRLKVIDITLEHLIWFVLILIACIFLFIFCTI